MCPFRKAFPLVLLLHLLLAVGIMAGYAAHSDHHVFTLISAVGSGHDSTQGLVADDDEDERPREDHENNDSLDMMPPYDHEDEDHDSSSNSPASKITCVPVVAQAPSVAGSPSTAPQVMGAAINVTQIGTKMTPPIALKRQQPHWSSASHGQVVLAFTINKLGKVEGAQVESASNPEMSKAALSVLPKWRFSPAKEDGKSVELKVRQVVEF